MRGIMSDGTVINFTTNLRQLERRRRELSSVLLKLARQFAWLGVGSSLTKEDNLLLGGIY